jgi:predicted nucleotidyltransferase
MATHFLSLLEKRKKKKKISKKEAVDEVKRLASLLREKFRFESLYLTGSFTTDAFHEHSDLDLIIEGMSIKDFFKAYALLLKESRRPIDVKPFEDLTPDFQKKIFEGGLRIG